ncbi:single-stranded DNA-binding protein [Nocardioides rubriscoriae]|uniref:single-stranded DNA-binding protein n=1 Tax=Nocardioides rubriscoriae TaxID=642762 RepID=UPI0011E01D27|nr:single-stranded DNA-binding protein [Nocardioides rubriscoriae]
MAAQHKETVGSTQAAIDEVVNEVRLVGRLTAAPEEKQMPSGDTLVSFRVVVARVPDAKRRTTVDALECVAWTARTKRAALSWRVGDVVEVTGELRRRFFRTAAGPASRVEVEVTRGRVLRRARTG